MQEMNAIIPQAKRAKKSWLTRYANVSNTFALTSLVKNLNSLTTT